MTDHCRPDYSPSEQHMTCVRCAAPLADNALVQDAYKVSAAAAWAKGQLAILAQSAHDNGMQWIADEADRIRNGLRLLEQERRDDGG